MTEQLKKLLHDYGLLHVTIHSLEEKHTKKKKISIKDYDESLGELLPGEPAIIVKISREEKSEFVEYDGTEMGINEDYDTKKISVLKLPEDEFYFFEAFRLGIFNLEQEIPDFIHGMWVIYSYGLFEFYLMKILKERFQIHPKLLSGNKTLTSNDLIEAISREELLDKFIDLEVRDLLYLPINGSLTRMRHKLGFKKLNSDSDSQIRKISLIRNCLAHNGGYVNEKLANEYPTEFKLNDRLTLSIKIVDEVIHSLRKFAYEIDKIFESINKYAP
jgi:hypothetical protein